MIELELYFDKKDFPKDGVLKKIDTLTVSDKQKIVMKTLLKIPYGETISYSDFAILCGFDGQVRNIATLIGKNPLPVIVPCHRVVRKNGKIGEFIFGTKTKESLIDFEKKSIKIDKKTMNMILNSYKTTALPF